MANFCSHCGQQLSAETKFCANCGKAVNGESATARKGTIYDGEIHKCPNCGDVLGSFVSTCPSCGRELRGTKIADSLKDFSSKIQQAISDAQRVTLIRNFPIANTKEDIFEFMILASSNLTGEFNTVVFNAWLAKFEQCYQKAKLVFAEDADFAKIQNLYDQTSKQINKKRVMHGANKVGTTISKIAATFPNPVFGIVVVLLGIYEITRILTFNFAGIDIIIVSLILWGTYKITNKKK